MRIEEEVFARHRIIPDKLIAFGFTSEGDRLTYARELPDDGMKIVLEYDGAISGRIIDLTMNDDYTAFRQAGGKKWFAVMGSVPLNKVDREAKSAQPVEVVNVKVDQDRVGDFLARAGIYEAFHMNKKCCRSIQG